MITAFYAYSDQLQYVALNRIESRKFHVSPIAKTEVSVLVCTLNVHVN